jgi:hypothetical protein
MAGKNYAERRLAYEPQLRRVSRTSTAASADGDGGLRHTSGASGRLSGCGGARRGVQRMDSTSRPLRAQASCRGNVKLMAYRTYQPVLIGGAAPFLGG